MASRAQLVSYANLVFDANGVGGIAGPEINQHAVDIANSAPIKGEAGDLASGLAWVGGVLTITAVSWSLLTGVPATFAPSAHAHPISDVTGLQAALDGKAGLAGAAFTGAVSFVLSPTVPNVTLGDNTLKAANTAFVTAAVSQGFETNDALVYKGPINASANPNYPAANAGHTYKITAAGKIGGAAGPNVEIGDTLYCNVDGSVAGTHAAVGASWTIVQTNIDGAVIGPTSAISGAPVLFDGTTGKLIRETSYAAFKTSLAIVAADVSGLSAFATSTDLANATGLLALARITGGADNMVLRMNGSAVQWSTVPASSVSGLAAIATSGSADHLASGTVPAARVLGGAYSFSTLTITGANLFFSGTTGFLRNTSIDGADNGTLILTPAGDAGVGRGAYMQLFGNEHAGAGRLDLYAGTGGAIRLNGAAISAFATSTDLANATGILADARLVGAYSGITALTMSGSLNIGGHVLAIAANVMSIRATTADGADTCVTNFAGGGNNLNSRGAYISAYGNEHATLPGRLSLNVGAGASATLEIAGNTNIAGNLTASNLATPYLVASMAKVWTGIADGAWASQTIAVAGAATTDVAIANHSNMGPGCVLEARVSSAGNVIVHLLNLTGGSLTLASGTLTVIVFKSTPFALFAATRPANEDLKAQQQPAEEFFYDRNAA